ncbi:MAG: G-D-S-L family lipolytic protein [Ferruginibacter sp.]|nr:G-D-S-L family lipolytic protein [Cytophagales bacterium]
MKKPFALLLLASIGFLPACQLLEEYGPPDPKPKQTPPSFAHYIAVGNSLTAGYSNNGLYREGQEVSFTNLLAGQLRLVGGGAYRQPLFSEAQKNGSGYQLLTGFDEQGNPIIERVNTDLAVRGLGRDSLTPLLTKYPEPVDNLGVPGIKVANVLTPGYGLDNPLGFNPFYERLLPEGQELTTYLQFISGRHHTFFTCWLGNNDALEYASSGATLPATPVAVFSANLKAVLDSLTAHGAKGVVTNISAPTSLPYFTTVTVAGLRAAAGGAPVWIRTGTGTVRQATQADLIRLEADSIGVADAEGLPKGYAEGYPLPNEDVLDQAETAQALAITEAYNGVIHHLAATKHLALADADAFLKKIAAGVVEDGVPVNSQYITGNMFALDGVHLTPKGNAIAANEFIRVINQYYRTDVPRINTAAYPALLP